ncbi:LuxR C-terminal-related transcriptional regulator [Marinospirillum minutulum]|uniref:LuxR C-terminal-related transcriptional regulator n=1 Tax=Marinospirillum minutulum TaxID=64974 RepID=UPI00041EA2C5|nr:LuxR C-terminal-related transcriptional regulator [Marinospirillum minutulum]
MAKQPLTTSAVSVIAELTQRQEQILALMQQGKVNKEIAKELNISLGTVKQHLVTIFKKLNVKNRTMAVARLAEFKDQSEFDTAFSQQTLITHRPAIILSLKIPSQLPLTAMKLFHTSLSEMAFDNQALFISREAGDGDLIFGLKRSSTQDMRMAIQVAEHFFHRMQAFIEEQPKPSESKLALTGALIAGLIKVSQNRFGGWSGETVGSHLLTQAHKLRSITATGYLAFDSSVLSIMQAFDLLLPSSAANQLAFSELHQLNNWNTPTDLPLIGRDSELLFIHDLLAKKYSILVLEGESGMGKSRLCREAARLALKDSWQVFYVHALSSGLLTSEQHTYLDRLDKVLLELSPTTNNFLILDNAHHLTAENKTLLINFLNKLPKNTQVIISGRQPQSYAISKTLSSIYRLKQINRLDKNASVSLINSRTTEEQTTILDQARGIPLFIRELVKATNDAPLSLALMITIASRIDKFKVDWKLLYCIAIHQQPVTLQHLSELMKDDLIYTETSIKQAEALGILNYQAGVASFKHPLVKKALSYFFHYNPNTNLVK